jgi:AcrR family transcriptional regulator
MLRMPPHVKAPARGGPRERTRTLLINAARDLLRSGSSVTVQAVAEHAGVSRATAYRYFNSNDGVVLQATLPMNDDPLADPEWPYARPDPGADLPTRAAVLVRGLGEWAFDHEHELRAVLALSLGPNGSDHAASRGRLVNRGRWIATLLDDLPAEVSAAQRRRLAGALIPLFGADAVVWARDIAGLDRRHALDTLAWMAHTLVRATIDDGGRDAKMGR